jgi:hypothetical protein
MKWPDRRTLGCAHADCGRRTAIAMRRATPGTRTARLPSLPRRSSGLGAMIVRLALSRARRSERRASSSGLSPAGIRHAAMHPRPARRCRVDRERAGDGGDAVAHVRDPRADLRNGSNPAPESDTVKSSAPPRLDSSTETGAGPACWAALSSAAGHEKYTAISTSGLQRRTPFVCTVTGRPDRTPAEASAAANPNEVSSAG